MTSWTRGKENEEMGERELSDNDPGDNVEGVARKVAGEVEQGVDNVKDRITGRQKTLKGTDPKPATPRKRSPSSKPSGK